MTWYRVNVLVGQSRQVLEIQADRASVTWFGELLLETQGRMVAHFRLGQWGSFWEVGALRAELDPSSVEPAATDGERPPSRVRSRGPFEVRERPRLP